MINSSNIIFIRLFYVSYDNNKCYIIRSIMASSFHVATLEVAHTEMFFLIFITLFHVLK